MNLPAWIAPARAALLLVDMQVDFVAPGHALDWPGGDLAAVHTAVAQAERLAGAARAAGVACVFTRLVVRPGDDTPFWREWKARRGADWRYCHEGSPGVEFAGPQPQGGEMVFSKKRYSAFAGTGLDAALRGLGCDTLVLAGLTTECCIDSTARAAFERDYHVFVVRDATACAQPALQEAALRTLEINCASLVSAADVYAAWETHSRGK